MKSLNRRRFLGAAIGTGAAAATAGPWAPSAAAHGDDGWDWGRGGRVPRNRIGMQLWSVRRVMTDSASAEAMLRFLARIGYTEIEPFGESYGWTAAQFRAVLDRLGLRAPSRHGHDFSMLEPGDGWKTAFQRQLEDANTMGQKYSGLAWFPGPYTTAQFTFMADRFNEAGALAKAAGLQFFYHNHDFEFTSKQPDGTPNYNILLEQTDYELVKFELDLYWIVFGGESPVHYLAEDPARWPLYHVKDKTWRDRPDVLNPDGSVKEVVQEWEDCGPGSIDFPDIFEAGDGRRLDKHFIVEHDWPLLSHPDDEEAEHKTSLAGVKYLRDVRW
jgi:sugar phosphate isomerase/epimerase